MLDAHLGWCYNPINLIGEKRRRGVVDTNRSPQREDRRKSG